MRIIFLRTTNRISGAEIYNLNLLKELTDNSNLQIILLTNSESLKKRANKLGLQSISASWLVKEIGTKKELLRVIIQLPVMLFECMKAIKVLEKKGRIDLICLQTTTEKIFLTPLFYFFKYKVIWIEHGPLYSSQMSRIITLLYRMASMLTNRIIAVSQDTKTDLVSNKVSFKKVEVIYIGVDTEKLEPLGDQERVDIRSKMHLDLKSNVIGFLGTVTKEKGIEDFLSISVQLIRSGGNFEFLIVGNGPDLVWMKNKVKRLNLEGCYYFIGFAEDVKKYLGIIDFFLFPTIHNEGISMAMLEAQSMEKIVLTRDIGGNSEIIENGINGYLYKHWDNQVVSREIIDHDKNSKFFLKMGKHARKNIMRKFNIKKQANEFRILFSSL